MTNKKLALVDIMGGLGNQLHQVNFANYLKENNYNVLVSTEWYNFNQLDDKTTKRNLEINIEDFNLIKADGKILKKFDRLNNLIKIQPLKRVYRSRINKFYKLHKGDVLLDNSKYLNNRYTGYWQDAKYLLDRKNYFIEALCKNSEFKSNLNNQSKDVNTVIHIRKGDYINWGEDLPSNYYLNALQRLRKFEETIKYDIFTDEQNVDINKKIFKEAENIFNNLNEKPLITLSRMQGYKNFIISNSSFSFFAAYLSRSKDKKVLYPNPWFKTVSHVPYTDSDWLEISY